MRKVIDRTGEKGINNFGSEIVIVKYRNTYDIDVYFPEYNWTAKGITYQNFKNGKIKCPYERSVYTIGYLGEGEYKASKNRKLTRIYSTWHRMLQRCYSEKEHKRQPAYIGCKACEEWHNFQNFSDWDKENYYKIEDEIMELDKDILVKHNKIYSPETCIYVPQTINSLFTKCDRSRGESVIGTSLKDGKYQVRCNVINLKTRKFKREYLGRYTSEQEAFEVYKQFKENYIKEIANYFKKQIPQKLYQAMYDYEVEIDD